MSTEEAAATDQCVQFNSLNTEYNENSDVPPFVGIMFEVYATTDLEVLTLELDLQMDYATDLSVEIYTIEGEYKKHINAIDQWQLLARTQAIPYPGRKNKVAIIPVMMFTPVTIASKQKRSFYVTMNGPYLDHTVYALQQTGDLHTRSPDLDVFVGSGFSGLRFPDSGIDTTVDPQFAGVIHYRKNEGCDTRFVNTSVEYQFIFNQTFLATEIRLSVKSAIDETVELLLEENPVLKGYKEEHGLEKLLATKTDVLDYSGKFIQKLLEIFP
jgi:hypothetical protein